MDYLDKLKQFMKFINQKYETDGTFRTYGEFPGVLINHSGIDFGNGKEQLSAMDVLLQQGLIECVKYKKCSHVESGFRIRPSLSGLKSTKQDWAKVFETVTKAITEGAIKGFIR